MKYIGRQRTGLEDLLVHSSRTQPVVCLKQNIFTLRVELTCQTSGPSKPTVARFHTSVVVAQGACSHVQANQEHVWELL